MAKKKLAYFKWYPADFETDERAKLMNAEEIGIYVLCLSHSWVNGSLPPEPSEISRALKIPPKQFERAWPRVRPCFLENESGRLFNKRQEEERAEAEAKSKKATESIRIRYERSDGVLPQGNETPRASDSDSDVNSVSGSEEKKEGEVPPEFDEQFQDYRRLFTKAAGGAVIDEDFQKGSFCWRAWCLLDFAQRTLVIQGLTARIAARCQVKHRAASYLQSGEYKRPIAMPTPQEEFTTRALREA